MDRKPLLSARSVKPARIVLVDDHQMFREGLAEVLGREKDLLVCGQAEDRSQALDVIDKTKPDLALVDLTLRGSTSLELIKDLRARHPRLAVLVLSMHEESLFAARTLAAGARGYLTKQQATRKLVEAIRRVLAGQIYLSEPMAAQALNKLAGLAAPTTVAQLSDRELETFRLIGTGHGPTDIAARLHIDVKTVESYRSRIREKLGLRNAAELRRHAIAWLHSGADI